MTDHVMSARDLRKRYRRGVAVDGVSLHVAPGERVALVGPNGAGKTTTLMMCLGAVRPDAGTVEILGQRTERQRRAVLARVGFAAGYLPLPPHIRVIEYLTMFGRLYGSPDPKGQARAALDRFGIGHLARAIGTEMSSGQRTLVGIVKATMHAPALLILDEPTASLDPDIALRVRTSLLELCESEGTALLVTSHNMTEVERLADRVVFLMNGRVIVDGALESVAARLGQSNLEDVYLHLSTIPQASRARRAT
ncbi:ABC transporter ATP-binding protein [Actinoallomurus rhizosphaericola]|uniref:ABC transporter ATP-binding protein n=1 Tax=Actinoallomurus rhizosphaericola TaxID=2952536 RepID=UPI002093B13E|nr:ABC transporter ATP-binding protein [Actinoallomurus rhizosphaericola]MCO5998092.1 ABC transporter ATP-binding protein [Actinoallomurus rhizosphaericola]